MRAIVRRRLFGSLIVLGAVTSALGGFGVFAAFSDTVATGENSVTSEQRARVADLWIALDGVSSPASCENATYLPETTTAFFHLDHFIVSTVSFVRYFCLRNVGTGSLTVVSTVKDVTETDVSCTGDEKVVDDTCGGDGLGELGAVLAIDYMPVESCSPETRNYETLGPLVAGHSMDWGSIGPGATLCGRIAVGPADHPTEEQLQAAQTDRVTWRFQFDGTAAP